MEEKTLKTMEEKFLLKIGTLAEALLDEAINAVQNPQEFPHQTHQIRDVLDLIDTYLDLRDGRKSYYPTISISATASPEEIKKAIAESFDNFKDQNEQPGDGK